MMIMSRTSWVASLYGYLVCVIAVITFLVSVSGFVDAAFERSNPLLARSGWFGPGGASLTSFEAFRASQNDRSMMTAMSSQPGAVVMSSGRPAPARPVPATGDTLTTEQLRARYEVLRADRIAQSTFSASQSLVKDGLLIILSIALFGWHWRWLRTQRDPVTA